jgi:hypothetical protein
MDKIRRCELTFYTLLLHAIPMNRPSDFIVL